jgi:hypothetical protein
MLWINPQEKAMAMMERVPKNQVQSQTLIFAAKI